MKGPMLSADMPAMLDLDEKQLPQIKDWQINKTYKLIIEAEMVNHGKGSFGDMPMRGSFKILSAKSAGEIAGEKPNESEKAPDKETKVSVLKNKAQTA